MAIDTTSPRSRRALLGAVAGAVAATAVSAVTRPLTAEAFTDHVRYVNDETARDVIHAESVWQETFPQSGQGTAVYAQSDFGTGVHAIGGSVGVEAYAERSGVYGHSSGGDGVYGKTLSGHGVRGVNASPTVSAVLGQSSGNNTGLQGYSGGDKLPASPANTGVFGSAHQDATAVGVRGSSSNGRGGVFYGAVAQLRMEPAKTKEPPAKGATGDLFVGASGGLWFCKGGATWVKLA